MPIDYKSNGCGSDKARFDFIPDTIYGISIFESCRRHDWAYMVGGDINDFNKANMEFLSNMLIQIDEGIVWWKPTFLARRRAMSYYEGVARFGLESFNLTEVEAINV